MGVGIGGGRLDFEGFEKETWSESSGGGGVYASRLTLGGGVGESPQEGGHGQMAWGKGSTTISSGGTTELLGKENLPSRVEENSGRFLMQNRERRVKGKPGLERRKRGGGPNSPRAGPKRDGETGVKKADKLQCKPVNTRNLVVGGQTAGRRSNSTKLAKGKKQQKFWGGGKPRSSIGISQKESDLFGGRGQQGSIEGGKAGGVKRNNRQENQL